MHGGKRQGAGRKPGVANAKTRDVANRAAQEGLTPLEFMLDIMRDDTQEKGVRFEAAKAAAPYIHPRLSSVDAKVDAGEVRDWLTTMD